MARLSKTIEGLEARERDWQAQIEALKLSHLAHEGQIAVHQRMLKSIAQNWSVDLSKLEGINRETFEELARQVQTRTGATEEAPDTPKKKGARK